MAPGLRRRRRHRQLAVVLASVVLLLAAGTVARALIRRSPPDAGPAAGRGLAWVQAAAWINRQVSEKIAMTCDPMMCAQLRWEGLPASQLHQLPPGPDPRLRTPIVVVTPDLRRQFGPRLGTTLAPGLIARFGAGDTAVEVRVAAPAQGSFWRLVAADVANRRADGVSLMTSPIVRVTPTARRQLAAGAVDSRLIGLVATLAAPRGVLVAAFGDGSPDAGTSVSPLRSVELAQPASNAMPNSDFIGSLLAFARAQGGVFANQSKIVSLRHGRKALRISVPAPSLLGLLGEHVPDSPIYG